MRRLWNNHPNLVSWAVLALGMVIIVVLAARNVGFQPTQWAAIIGATILLAGLCVWIVSWEDGADDRPADAGATATAAVEASSPGKEQEAAPQQAPRSSDV
jgi:ABC-type nickel/cobalt efflux system permease component RcnA